MERFIAYKLNEKLKMKRKEKNMHTFLWILMQNTSLDIAITPLRKFGVDTWSSATPNLEFLAWSAWDLTRCWHGLHSGHTLQFHYVLCVAQATKNRLIVGLYVKKRTRKYKTT